GRLELADVDRDRRAWLGLGVALGRLAEDLALLALVARLDLVDGDLEAGVLQRLLRRALVEGRHVRHGRRGRTLRDRQSDRRALRLQRAAGGALPGNGALRLVRLLLHRRRDGEARALKGRDRRLDRLSAHRRHGDRCYALGNVDSDDRPLDDARAG